MDAIHLSSQSGIISLDTSRYSPETRVVVEKSWIYTTIGSINAHWLNVVWNRLSPETRKVIIG